MITRIKSALFVDFDNIFIGLKEDDERAADEFGRGVKKWLRWIEDEMARPGEDTVRDVLVRRCYGNPETFAPYRGYFTRAGFSVVDCPSLTGQGKNSADIVMVMDILDALAHPTKFNEFILMSADADFTPLVLRLRMHDRRTVAIVAGNTAAAYKASCDLVVPDDEFVERALRLPPVAVPRAAPRLPQTQPAASATLLDAIARRLYEEASGSGEVPAARLPEIFREFREFTPYSNWLGFFTLRSLTEALIARRPELRMTEDEAWKVVVDVSGAPVPAAGAQPALPVNGDGGDLRARIVEAVRQFVRGADGPVVMARVAQHVTQVVGQRVLETRWAGAGTFRNLLEGVDDLGLVMVSSPQPGYLYDAERHTPPEPPSSDTRPANLEGLPEELVSFIRRISDLTDTPRLSPRQYAMLFEVIAKEIERTPYELTYTSRIVRDQMLERGETVSRQYTSFVLRGIYFVGYRFQRTGVDEAPALAYAFLKNVLNLLRSAQVALTEREHELLREWLLQSSPAQAAAGLAAPSAELPRPAEPAPFEPGWTVAEPGDGPPARWASAEGDANRQDGGALASHAESSTGDGWGDGLATGWGRTLAPEAGGVGEGAPPAWREAPDTGEEGGSAEPASGVDHGAWNAADDPPADGGAAEAPHGSEPAALDTPDAVSPAVPGPAHSAEEWGEDGGAPPEPEWGWHGPPAADADHAAPAQPVAGTVPLPDAVEAEHSRPADDHTQPGPADPSRDGAPSPWTPWPPFRAGE
ncbi:MAG TPA: NYN domain-containing protein [Longimicrobium sp.]|jgi:hypothetical protein